MFPRNMVCLRNINVDTLHKGDTDDDDDNDDDNNNIFCSGRPILWHVYYSDSVIIVCCAPLGQFSDTFLTLTHQ